MKSPTYNINCQSSFLISKQVSVSVQGISPTRNLTQSQINPVNVFNLGAFFNHCRLSANVTNPWSFLWVNTDPWILSLTCRLWDCLAQVHIFIQNKSGFIQNVWNPQPFFWNKKWRKGELIYRRKRKEGMAIKGRGKEGRETHGRTAWQMKERKRREKHGNRKRKSEWEQEKEQRRQCVANRGLGHHLRWIKTGITMKVRRSYFPSSSSLLLLFTHPPPVLSSTDTNHWLSLVLLFFAYWDGSHQKVVWK